LILIVLFLETGSVQPSTWERVRQFGENILFFLLVQQNGRYSIIIGVKQT
jgi:hypothetical protein